MKKQSEMSKQFEEIYRNFNDPEFQDKVRRRLKKELEKHNKEKDFGL